MEWHRLFLLKKVKRIAIVLQEIYKFHKEELTYKMTRSQAKPGIEVKILI